MPTFKGVTVEIHCPKKPPTDPENFSWSHVEHGATPEYGNQRLKGTPKTSVYIPAVTNCPFAVSIAILDSYEPKVKGDDRESLAAYVYFDGKSKEETATLLRRGVETWISSRWLEVGDGKLAEREFVFREVGLENFFNFLDISKEKEKDAEATAPNRRHSMPARMKDEDEGESSTTPKLKESAGQIRVDLFRVRCEGPVRRGVWGDMFKDHLNSNGDDTGAVDDVDVSHTAGFSEPKPLDKETVSTQSVSHLDPEGVVFASFIFYYRSERALRKMNLIRDPPKITRSQTAVNTPAKSTKHDFTSFSADSDEVIPKGPDLFKPKAQTFSDFRDTSASTTRNAKSRKTMDDNDEDETLVADEFGRDEKDMQREFKKSAEEVRMEEELAAEVERTLKLKRTHSTTSLKGKGSEEPATPPKNSIFQPPPMPTQRTPGPSQAQEPETPAKRRRESRAADVKSPPSSLPSNGLSFGAGSMDRGFGGPPERGFGGLLPSPNSMEEEEEL